jgi:predicted nucleic acid-binding protein
LNAVHLLTECFSNIHIPKAVSRELGNIKLPEEIENRSITASGRQFVDGALGRLHIGELEAMVLCRELKADYLILDDMTARRRAKRMGLQVMGTVGVILLACRKKCISAEKAVFLLDELVEKHGLYISVDLLEQAKKKILL